MTKQLDKQGSGLVRLGIWADDMVYTVVFGVVGAEYAYRLRSHREQLGAKLDYARDAKFRAFIVAVSIAYLTVLIRTIYRIPVSPRPRHTPPPRYPQLTRMGAGNGLRLGQRESAQRGRVHGAGRLHDRHRVDCHHRRAPRVVVPGAREYDSESDGEEEEED